MSETLAPNCVELCINGCVLGDQCPHRPYQAQTAQFLQGKSIDDILAIAEARIERLRAAHRNPDQPK